MRRYFKFFLSLFMFLVNAACSPKAFANDLSAAQSLVNQYAASVAQQLPADANKILFNNAYANAIDHNAVLYGVDLNGFSKTFVITGDWGCYGPAAANQTPPPTTMSPMWIRDAAAQFHAYLGMYQSGFYSPAELLPLTNVIEGVINTEAADLNNDVVANAFDPSGAADPTAGHDYEVDSLAFFMWLSYDFWKTSGDTHFFENPNFHAALEKIITQIQLGQRYRFVYRNGKMDRIPVSYTGMTTTEYRASDDPALLPFNIPDNQFLTVALKDAAEMFQTFYPEDETFAQEALKLQSDIQNGIDQFGSYTRNGKKIYAYEMGDGWVSSFANLPGNESTFYLTYSIFSQAGGDQKFNDAARNAEVSVISPQGKKTVLAPDQDYHITDHTLTLAQAPAAGSTVQIRSSFVLMDDANLPSLLSAPYFGYRDTANRAGVSGNTRAFVLSSDNPYYFSSGGYAGEGSVHLFNESTLLDSNIWPLGLIAQGETAAATSEKQTILKMLDTTAVDAAHPGLYACDDDAARTAYPARNYIHESFDGASPGHLTRGWFGWANAFFGEWVDQLVREGVLS